MARRRTLRIAYATVDGGQNYAAEALRDEDGRFKDLAATVAALSDEDVDLLVFPAGYFQVPNARAQRTLEKRLRAGFGKALPTFGIVCGVDLKSNATKAEKSPTIDEHPYFALYRASSGDVVPMQQVSVTRSEGAEFELLERRWGDRSLVLPDTQVAFLICGESWSDELLWRRVASSGCRALAIAAHRTVKMHRKKTGYGKLSWHLRLDAFSRKHGIPIVLSEHTRSPNRHPYAWPRSISTPLEFDGVPGGVTLRLASV